jgi:hypothetical protein
VSLSNAPTKSNNMARNMVLGDGLRQLQCRLERECRAEAVAAAY